MVQYKWDKYAGTELPVTANMYWQISIGTQVERGPEEGFQMEWIWTIWGFSSREWQGLLRILDVKVQTVR